MPKAVPREKRPAGEQPSPSCLGGMEERWVGDQSPRPGRRPWRPRETGMGGPTGCHGEAALGRAKRRRVPVVECQSGEETAMSWSVWSGMRGMGPDAGVRQAAGRAAREASWRSAERRGIILEGRRECGWVLPRIGLAIAGECGEEWRLSASGIFQFVQ